MTALQQVLDAFASSDDPRSLRQLARELNMDRTALEEMILFWVRKGKLREVPHECGMCSVCGARRGCTRSPQMPRRFELVTDADDPTISESCPHCSAATD